MKKIVLRDYQEELLKTARDAYQSGTRRILLQSPTGSGKGILAASFAHNAASRGKHCLLVVHRREIVHQLADHLRSFGLNPSIVMASAGVKADPGCTVASIQTLHSRVQRGVTPPPADLIFIDEAHRSSARSYAWLVDAYPEATHIGLTATPCRMDDKPLSGYWEDLICGPQIPDLIKRGHLSEVRMFTLPADAIDVGSVKKARGDYSESDLSRVMDKSILVSGIVEKWKALGEGNRTIVFATGVEHSKHIVRSFIDAGVPAAHLDGSMPLEERQGVIESLRNGSIQVLSNCMVLTEGFDLPSVKTVVLARPTKSKSLYLQMAGRALRPFEGKQCIILDHACCYHEHGRVDQDWEWSLTDSARSAGKRQPGACCPACMFVNDFGADVCAECGALLVRPVNDNDERKGPQMVDGELVEITNAVKARAAEMQAKSLWDELWKTAITSGYRDGWVYREYEERTGRKPYEDKLYPTHFAEAFYPHLHERGKIRRESYVARAAGFERTHREKWAAKIEKQIEEIRNAG